MPNIEITRTLVKSPPELWAELEGERLAAAVEATEVRPTEPERELRWQADYASGAARLEPTSWGTKVTLTAELEEEVARGGLFMRFSRRRLPPPPTEQEIEQRLSQLLDDLGQAHRKPFVR